MNHTNNTLCDFHLLGKCAKFDWVTENIYGCYFCVLDLIWDFTKSWDLCTFLKVVTQLIMSLARTFNQRITRVTTYDLMFFWPSRGKKEEEIIKGKTSHHKPFFMRHQFRDWQKEDKRCLYVNTIIALFEPFIIYLSCSQIPELQFFKTLNFPIAL